MSQRQTNTIRKHYITAMAPLTLKMIPFENVESVEATIIKITALCPPREQAFFAIMRQSGLKPNAIKKLKLKDVDDTNGVPFKISFCSENFKQSVFIGEEGARYLGNYIATRKELLEPQSLLFVSHYDSNKEINTKDVSRTFRHAAEKVMKGNTKRLQLFDLVKFYRNKAKHYLIELKNHPPEDDEHYKNLYIKHALPFLEIEKQITYHMQGQRKLLSQETESQSRQIESLERKIVKDNEYISSILSLLYDNKGDWNTGENVKLGDNFIKLWQKVSDEQLRNTIEFLNGQSKYVPFVDVLEALTKTLKRILRRYEEAKNIGNQF
jgi:hypothetical protein